MLLRAGSIKQMTEKETCCPESKLDLLNAKLFIFRNVLEGTEIPECGGRGRLY